MTGEVILRVTAETDDYDMSIQLVQDEEVSHVVVHSSSLSPDVPPINMDRIIKAAEFAVHIHYSMKPNATVVMKRSFNEKLPDEGFPEKVFNESGVFLNSFYMSFSRMRENHQFRSWHANDKKFIVDTTKDKFIKDSCFLILSQIVSEFIGEVKRGA